MSFLPFPLEIVIEGTPVSQQASAASRGRWVSRVRASVMTRVRETSEWEWLDDRPVAVTIFYFPASEMLGDIDNITKPILDAMRHVAYPDDGVVERVLTQRFEPGLPWVFQTKSTHHAGVGRRAARDIRPHRR